MDAFKERCSPTEHDLALANSVRLFLKVLTLSDITEMEGLKIAPWARIGSPPRISSLQWPVQPPPIPTALRVWRRFLIIAFGNGSKMKRVEALPLRRPLGRWLAQPHVRLETYMADTRLYVRREDGSFDFFISKRPSTWLFISTGRSGPLPSHVSPTSVSKFKKIWFAKQVSLSIPVPTVPQHDPQSYLKTCPPQERRILGFIPSVPHILQSAVDLGSKKLVAATDGSFDPYSKKASGCRIMASRDGKTFYRGVCPVDGSPDAMDSYRAKLEAIRSLTYYIRFLRRIISTFTTDVHLEVWIDNMEP